MLQFETRNESQLRHDLRNGPAHVFGEHSNCNTSFCKYASQSTTSNVNEDDNVTNDSPGTSHSQCNTLEDQIDAIIEDETISSNDEALARNGHKGSLDDLPEGLYVKMLQYGDRLVMMAEQLIDNETSNLAECYMSIRSCFNGGKQYNRVQSGSLNIDVMLLA